MRPSRRRHPSEPVARAQHQDYQGNHSSQEQLRAEQRRARARGEMARTTTWLVVAGRRTGHALRQQVSRVARWVSMASQALLLPLLLSVWLLKLALAPWVAARAERLRAWVAPRIHRQHAWLASWLARRVEALRPRWQAARIAGAALAATLAVLLARLRPHARRGGQWIGERAREAPRRLRLLIAAARARRVASAPWAPTDPDDFAISQDEWDPVNPDRAPVFLASGTLPGRTLRLSVRGRAWRGLLIAATIGLALFVVLGGPATLLAGMQQWAESFAPPRAVAAAPPELNASFWVARRIPYQALDARGIFLAPSAASSSLAYACWVDGRSGHAGALAVNLYVTPDSARSWQALPVPVNQAHACQPVADAADLAHVLLVLTPSTTDACAAPSVYASADSGTHWAPVTLPEVLAGACDPAFFLSHGLIYAWSPAAQAEGTGGPAAQVLISGDNGLSWRPVFGAVPAGATVALVAARADGALLLLVSTPATRPASAPSRTLWCRPTADAAWQTLAALPAGTSTAFATNGQPTGPGCSWGAVYAAGFSTGGDPAITRLEVSSGRGWQMLPSVPVAGAASTSPLTPDGHVLSVAPGNTLLVDIPYFGPGTSVTADTAAPAHTFWGWDPHAGRWLEDVHISPPNSSIDGFVWDYGENGVPRLICWIYTLNAGIPAFTGVYRAAFAAPSAPSQDAGDRRAAGL